MKFQIFTPFERASFSQVDQVAKFLYKHLGEYGDALEDIKKAIHYALKERVSHGGFVVVGKEGDEIVGTVVVNRTGMEGYIPENILVYIATHEDHRGKGYGKKLMKKALELAEGDIALHVESDNPAVHLYKKVGFENKYLEMRFYKEDDSSEENDEETKPAISKN